MSENTLDKLWQDYKKASGWDNKQVPAQWLYEMQYSFKCGIASLIMKEFELMKNPNVEMTLELHKIMHEFTDFVKNQMAITDAKSN